MRRENLVFALLLGAFLFLCSGTAKAIDTTITVTRAASDYYVGQFGFTGVIKTQVCTELANFTSATLILTTASTGTLIFSPGKQCTVVNVFDPATLAASNSTIRVNGNSEGYYEYTDGSRLIKASTGAVASSSLATLVIDSATNGFAFGTITVVNSFARTITNIYASRQSPPLTTQTITFNAQGDQTFVKDGTFSISPVATASSGLAVTYSASPASICTMGTGTTVNMISDGACNIVASQSGNASFSAATSVTQTVFIDWANFHSCAIANGGVKCWGFNSNGELGNNSTSNSPVPVQTIAAGSGATSVSVGLYHACAIVSGGLQCWGFNGNGQIGNGSTTNSLVPVQTISAGSNVTGVAAGAFHTCAVINGGVQCWGSNSNGKLGNGSTAQSLTPIQTIVAGSNASTVAAGRNHTCATINSGVKCWGFNGNGELGNNSTTQSLVPIQTIGPGSNVTTVSVGSYHGCAVVNAGLQCWGFNGNGQLGNSSTTASLTPVQTISAGSNVTAVSASLFHTCALVNGGVQCFGSNNFGQLGNNGIAQSLLPVQTIAAASNVGSIASGSFHTCAVNLDGSVKCWGNNGFGQLGDGTTINRLSPTFVTGMSQFPFVPLFILLL